MSVITKGDDGQTIPPPIPSARIPMRTWIIWIAIIGAIIVLTLMKRRLADPAERLSQNRFEELVDKGQIVQGSVFYDPQSPLTRITGVYAVSRESGAAEVPFQARVRLTPALEEKLFSLPQFEARQTDNVLQSVLFSVLPFVLIGIFIWFFFVRQFKKAKVSVYADPRSAVDSVQARFDKILDKWEQQAKRMDAVLDRMEREHPPGS